jgi:hypothetical protein
MPELSILAGESNWGRESGHQEGGRILWNGNARSYPRNLLPAFEKKGEFVRMSSMRNGWWNAEGQVLMCSASPASDLLRGEDTKISSCATGMLEVRKFGRGSHEKESVMLLRRCTSCYCGLEKL